MCGFSFSKRLEAPLVRPTAKIVDIFSQPPTNIFTSKYFIAFFPSEKYVAGVLAETYW